MVHQTSDATIEDNIHSSVSEITSEIVSCIYVFFGVAGTTSVHLC
jgi:hypothetical protein